MCASLNQVNEERDIRRANKLIATGRTVEVALGENIMQTVVLTKVMREMSAKQDETKATLVRMEGYFKNDAEAIAEFRKWKNGQEKKEQSFRDRITGAKIVMGIFKVLWQSGIVVAAIKFCKVTGILW